MRLTQWRWTIVALSGLASLACGGAQHPNRTGEYRGPNELQFVVTSPVRRQMDPERHSGLAVVTDSREQEITLELRMFEGGDPCQLTAMRSPEEGGAETAPETLAVQGDQRCQSRFGYDGTPVAAVVQIDEGTVRFETNSINVQLRGRFVADFQGPDGEPEPMEGLASWHFEGTQ